MSDTWSATKGLTATLYRLNIIYVYSLTNMYKFIKDNKQFTDVAFLFIKSIFIFIVVYVCLRYLKINIYESIDYKKKLILFGQTCDLENNKVSIDYSIGFQLAFNKINSNGGINGYKLKIILLNDKYEPTLSIKNAKLLIDYYNVLSLIGTFGTPTTVSILTDVIQDRHVSLIAPFSAGTSYRDPFNKNIIIMNASFYAEFILLCENLINNKYFNVSIIYQNDIYGQYFYHAFVDYFTEKKYPFNIISTGTHERNSNDIDGCLKQLFNVANQYDYSEYNNRNTIYNKIQAVIVFSSEKEIDTILVQLKKIKPSIAIYYNFFVGINKANLQYLKLYNTDNIYQTLLSNKNLNNYPILNKELLHEVQRYNEVNDKKIDDINTSLMQGFYVGLMIGKVLENFKHNMHDLNRESFINMFYTLKDIHIYDFKIGPFIIGKNNVGIIYSELNKLQKDLTFKTIKSHTLNFNEKYY